MSKLLNGYEKFNAVLEDEDTPDINIEIEIDAAPAEDAVEVQEMEEPMDAASEIVEASDEGENSAEMMAIFASALRTHGLTPSMLSILTDFGVDTAIGVGLPAYESLEPVGRNDRHAKQIIVALEAKSDSFWEKTKDALKRIWAYIKDMFTRAVTYFSNYQKRVTSAAQSLKDITSLDAERIKSAKYKGTEKDLCSDTILSKATAEMTKLGKTVASPLNVDDDQPLSQLDDAGLGVKKDGDDFVVDKDFFKTKEVSITANLLKECQVGGAMNKAAVGLAKVIVVEGGALSRNIDKKLKDLDAMYQSNKSVSAEGKDEEGKKKLKAAKVGASVVTKVSSHLIKVCKNGCDEYLRACSACRKNASTKA